VTFIEEPRVAWARDDGLARRRRGTDYVRVVALLVVNTLQALACM
jgi:hypothetical protein